MKKVSLVVLDKDREESLKKLRKLGVVHLERKSASSENLTKLLDRKARVENALGIARPYEAAKKAAAKNAVAKSAAEKAAALDGARNRRTADFENSGSVPFTSDALDGPEAPDGVSRILEYAEERKTLHDKLTALGRERTRIEEWGNFDSKDIPLLAERGKLNLYLYKLSRRAFESLTAETRYITVGADKNSVRLAVFDREIPGETPFAPSETSLKEIDFASADINDHLADIERQLSLLSAGTANYERELKTLRGRIEFETARAGMDALEDVPRESAVAWITGFVPQDELGVLKRGAAENGWALVSDDPGPDDFVPTKLKNNRFARILNPLTDFLEVVPGYHEADISGWFLFFFVIFFGMIFGDAAYGAIILIAALIGIFKTLKKGVAPIFQLLLLLGISNFVWGALTCTWFGVPVDLVPEVLQKISLPLISNVTAAKSAYDEGIVRQNLMILCFTLALLQLSIGHIIAITRSNTLKVLADIGSIAMLVGMYGIVLALIASNESRDLKEYIPMMPCAYVLGAGFVVNFVFANYEGSVGKSIVESLKNIISMILGIANVFSDIMSYIRLWAVGLAGAAISSTIDSMAGPMLGHFALFVFGVLLLVFGHGLNLVLNTLSVLVHGVRLNTLEFSGHVGLTWAGTAYKPFSETGIPESREVSEKKAG